MLLGFAAVLGLAMSLPALAQSNRFCSSYMCVTGTVNGSDTEYTLQSQKALSSFGWMAIGFGSQMAGSPMVIFWPNSDGTVTISQRSASGESMPRVQSNPTHVASLENGSTSLDSSNPQLKFSIASSAANGRYIWAYSTKNPGSTDNAATIVQHDGFGTFSLTPSDASATSTGTGGSSPGSTSAPISPQSGSSVAWTPREKIIVAHAAVASIGFIVVLPLGALLARYVRTVSSSWFKGHWAVQFALGGPLVLSGFVLGVVAVNKAGAPHLGDKHMVIGVVLFVLYVVQCLLGAFIHWVKPRAGSRFHMRRPPQNFLHAVLGLTILALSFYQVWLGYHHELPTFTSFDIPNGVNIAFIVWVSLVSAAYFLGLIFLRRQYKQERENRERNRLQSKSSPQ